MLLLLRKTSLSISLLITILVVSACGFTPVHSTNRDVLISEKFTSIKVEPINFGRAGQILRTNLENQLNPTNRTTEKLYQLNINVSNKKTPLAIEQDAEITRYNLTLTSKLSLTEIATGKVIFTDVSKVISSYQAVSSDFATYTVEEDTLTRAVKDAAEDIRMRLSSFLAK